MRRLLLLLGSLALLATGSPAHADHGTRLSYTAHGVTVGNSHVVAVVCEASTHVEPPYVPVSTTVGCSVGGVSRQTTLPGGSATTVVGGVFPLGIIPICLWGGSAIMDVRNGSVFTVTSFPICTLWGG